MKDGWIKQATQVPRGLADRFKQQSQAQGGGGIKVLSTVALAIASEMPEEYRRALVRYTVQKTVYDPSDLNPADLWKFLEQMVIHDHLHKAAREEQSAKWYIDRILDPELTQEPGKKPSDKAKQQRKAEGA